jgi:DNA-binding NtrC family response regulator
MSRNVKSANPDSGRILVVDDHAQARESMGDILRRAGHRVQCCSSAVEALQTLRGERSFDVVLTDLKMPGMSGLDLIRALHLEKIETQAVMVTAHATVASAVSAMRHGAFDYIEKPFDVDQLEQLVARAIRHGAAGGRRSSVPAVDGHALAAMIGSSAATAAMRQRIAQVAPTDVTVLITGESGSGKEVVARAIHAASRRSAGAMVSLNCPALSPQLMESELFGHERGAFTSADVPRVGRFELADGGTILLDEVTEISLPLQAKLLRVLQEKSFERVGSSQTRSVDVRVLATTNRDLHREVSEGRFREDLYFRLAVVPLHVPPLRERRDDILPLAEHFLGLAAQRLGIDPCRLSSDAIELLQASTWPGNVRELENLMTRASVLCSRQTLSADDLRPWLLDGGASVQVAANAALPVGAKLDDIERALIEATLEHYEGHRGKTAKALGIGVRTLANKLRSYGYAPRTKTFVGSMPIRKAA